MKTLKIKNITKFYGKNQALNNLSLDIGKGTFGLLGPNGAGKTTLIRILTTLLESTSGEITLGNINWTEANKVRNLIGYLPQKFSLYKHINVMEALTHIATMKGIKSNREEVVKLVIEKVNLTDHKAKKIGELSGGMIRRVGIAQAIIGNPQVIIVDEPTAGLDPEERIRFRKLLVELAHDSIVIISSHIVEDIEVTCNNVAILNKGILVASGDIESIRNIARGKIWELTIPFKDYYNISDSLEVISSHRIGDDYQLRILSDSAPKEAKIVEPSLEDSYLCLIRGEA